MSETQRIRLCGVSPEHATPCGTDSFVSLDELTARPGVNNNGQRERVGRIAQAILDIRQTVTRLEHSQEMQADRWAAAQQALADKLHAVDVRMERIETLYDSDRERHRDDLAAARWRTGLIAGIGGGVLSGIVALAARMLHIG